MLLFPKIFESSITFFAINWGKVWKNALLWVLANLIKSKLKNQWKPKPAICDSFNRNVSNFSNNIEFSENSGKNLGTFGNMPLYRIH